MDGIFPDCVRHAGVRRRPYSLGGRDTGCNTRTRIKRAIRTPRGMAGSVGPYGLDHHRAGAHASRSQRTAAVCAGPAQRQISSVDQQVARGVFRCADGAFLRDWRLAVCVLGVFVRSVMSLHFTWLVNSATHMWGSQRFETGDDSRNSFWVAVLTFGEGWHNNHHYAPQSARHGLRWYEIDVNWYGIWLMRAFGLAWDINLPKLKGAELPAAAD